MDRNAVVPAGPDRATARILEAGSNPHPVAPKRAGWRTTTVEQADRPGPVPVQGARGTSRARMEEVGSIDGHEALDAPLPERGGGHHDVLVARHVVGRLADPIGFLLEADRMIAPGGRLHLAIPGLRFGRGCMRSPSTTGQVIAAWRAGRARHACSAHFDVLAPDGSPGSTRGPTPPSALAHDLATAGASLHHLPEEDRHRDIHAWTFTPASFRLLMLELEAIGLIPWRVARLLEGPGVEFLAILERPAGPPLAGAALQAGRQVLLRRRWEEVRERADRMLGAAPPDRSDGAVMPLSAAEVRLRQAGALLFASRADFRP